MERKRNKKILLYAVLVILAVFLGGCIQNNREIPNNTSNEIVVGALLPLTGDLSFSGEAAKGVLEIAVEDVNDYLSETEPGMNVRLVIEDTETDPVVAVEKIKKLKEAGARFVIGTDSSAELEAVKPYADENGIILISHGSTAPSLAIAGDNVFRLLPDDTHQAEALATLMQEDGIKAVVPIWRGDVWGDGLHDATKTRFEALGGIVLGGVRYDPGTDFSSELETLSSNVSEAVSRYGSDEVAVHFIGFNEASTLFNKARNNQVFNVKWYGSDGTAFDDDLLNNTEVARFAAETGFSTPFYSIEIKELEERVKERVGTAHVFGLVAYDALWLSTLAYIASNKSADINVLKKTLVRTTGSYMGATGSSVFNEAGDRKFASYDIWEIIEKDGVFSWERVSKYPSDSLSPVLAKQDTEITVLLNKIDFDLFNAAHELSNTDLKGNEARKILRTLCALKPYAIDCATIDRNGRMLAIEPAEYSKFEGTDISKQEQIIRLHGSRKPVVSNVSRMVEGFDAVDFEYPVFSSEGEFTGSVSLLIRPESLLSATIVPAVQGLSVEVWAMQKDGRIIYDRDADKIGRMLFDDPLYKPSPQLFTLGKRVAAESSGSGTYEFVVKGEKVPVKKAAYWSTVGLHGTEWRLIVTRVK